MADYYNDFKQRVTLGRAIKSGGEGAVHDVVGLPDKVAKIYHPQKLRDDPDLAEKLRVMVANPPADPMKAYYHISIAWPESRLTTNGQFAGYLMPRIKQPHEILEFYNPTIRRQQHPGVTWKILHTIARNLAAALAAVHARQYVVGDLNEGNLFVNEVGLVTLIDTDSFQVRDPNSGRLFRCKVGKGAFTPAELQGLDLKSVDRQPSHDLFGLGVLIFHLLMEGHHPFTGVSRSQTSLSGQTVFERNIGQGNFPYAPGGLFLPPPAAPDFNNLHPQLQAMFRRCFLDGHKTPSARPMANEWHRALQTAEASLIQCGVNARHWYARHLTECPWCRREKLLAGAMGAMGQAAAQMQAATRPQPPPVVVRPPPAQTPQPRTTQPPPPPPPPARRRPFLWLLLVLLLLGGSFFALRGLGGGGQSPGASQGEIIEVAGVGGDDDSFVMPQPTDSPPVTTPAPTPRPPTPRPPTPRPPTPRPPTPRPPDSPLGSIVLYNAATGQRVATLHDGDTISLSDAGGPFLNIEAEVDGPGVDSVAFLLDGECVLLNERCLENTAPYMMAGDIDGRLRDNWDWSSLVGGTHTFEFVPFDQDEAQGNRLPSVTITLTISP